jgi:hypothetical protein
MFLGGKTEFIIFSTVMAGIFAVTAVLCGFLAARGYRRLARLGLLNKRRHRIPARHFSSRHSLLRAKEDVLAGEELRVRKAPTRLHMPPVKVRKIN